MISRRELQPASLALLLALAAPASAAAQDGAKVAPAGEPESLKTRVLEAGAALIQNDAPPRQLDVYVVGFHPMRDNPAMQVEAHHFCRQANEDFMQCALYDGGTREANLTGIEYIISERLFEGLPEDEKKYWHPHNGEILSGQLVAPGLPAPVEKELMRTKMNSYGKTWHVWNTGHAGMPGDRLPLGEPHLAWSFGREGEANPAMVEARDVALGVSTDAKRAERADLVSLARPQAGVDALKDRFGVSTRDIPGVVDKAAAAGAAPR